jgi:hypothetical protein
MTTDELLAVIAELRTYDHEIVSHKYAREIGERFGFIAETSVIEPDPKGTFKGTSLYDDAKYARGVGAADLARQICHYLNVDYDLRGEGGTLRSCCDNLTAYLKSRAVSGGRNTSSSLVSCLSGFHPQQR